MICQRWIFVGSWLDLLYRSTVSYLVQASSSVVEQYEYFCEYYFDCCERKCRKVVILQMLCSSISSKMSDLLPDLFLQGIGRCFVY